MQGRTGKVAKTGEDGHRQTAEVGGKKLGRKNKEENKRTKKGREAHRRPGREKGLEEDRKGAWGGGVSHGTGSDRTRWGDQERQFHEQ